jgi:hypothetical protein
MCYYFGLYSKAKGKLGLHELVYLQVSVDIPFKITRNTQNKEIETKRMKKDYFIVDDYNG